MQAIVFGSINTHFETIALQRKAFHRACQRANLPLTCVPERYGQLLEPAGATGCVRHYATALRHDALSKSTVEVLFRKKLRHYQGLLGSGTVRPRMDSVRLLRKVSDAASSLAFGCATKH